MSLLQASFIQPVAGTIYFRQVSGEDVQIWGKLYYTDDSPDSDDHTWHIHTTAVSNIICCIKGLKRLLARVQYTIKN